VSSRDLARIFEKMIFIVLYMENDFLRKQSQATRSEDAWQSLAVGKDVCICKAVTCEEQGCVCLNGSHLREARMQNVVRQSLAKSKDV
jgi:hypothetical protein